MVTPAVNGSAPAATRAVPSVPGAVSTIPGAAPTASGSARPTSGSGFFGFAPSGHMIALVILSSLFFCKVSSYPAGYAPMDTTDPATERTGTNWTTWLILGLICVIIILLIVIVCLCMKLRHLGQPEHCLDTSPASTHSTGSSSTAGHSSPSSPKSGAPKSPVRSKSRVRSKSPVGFKSPVGSKSPVQQPTTGNTESMDKHRDALLRKVTRMATAYANLKDEYEVVRTGSTRLSAQDKQAWDEKIQESETQLNYAKYHVIAYDANLRARERSAGRPASPNPDGSVPPGDQTKQQGQLSPKQDSHKNLTDD